MSNNKNVTSRKEINTFLQDLGSNLLLTNADLCLVQFGSSLDPESSFFNDIDLLLLDKNKPTSNYVINGITTLRNNMANSPISTRGFHIESEYVEIFNEKINQYFSLGHFFRVTSNFIFGPSLDKKNLNEISLHIKGPVNLDELIYFCKLFPLHAKSIFSMIRIIIGKMELPKSIFDFSINQEDFYFFNKNLYSRMCKTTELELARSLLKKLLQNIRVFNGREDILILHELSETGSLAVLKDLFFTSYEQCLHPKSTDWG